jgi:hypothetical protein
MTGHHRANKGIILRRPDGTPMTRQEVIIHRRGYFLWMPVLFSNDLVHGSWWFTFGSLVTALFAIYPLVHFHGKATQHDDTLPAADFEATWGILIVCGFLFTAGSLAFVRAFEEPPRKPLLHDYKHFQTDELLGAWLFLAGTVPSIPYMLIYFIIKPSAFYFFGLCAAVVFSYGTYLFVASCYPNDKKHQNYILPFMTRVFGPKLWVVKHLANDWLAGTWFFFWANAFMVFGSLIMLFAALALNNTAQIFIWFTGLLTSIIFQIGSMYFVSGSYPHAQQFYYAVGRGQVQKDPQHALDEEHGGDDEEDMIGDGVSLLGAKHKASGGGGKGKALGGSGDKTLRLSRSNLAALEESSAASSSTAKVKDPLKRMEDDVISPLHHTAATASAPPVKKVPIDAPDDKPHPAPHKPSRSAAAAAVSGGSNSNSNLVTIAASPLAPPPPVPILPPKDDNREDDDDDVDEEELGRRELLSL